MNTKTTIINLLSCSVTSLNSLHEYQHVTIADRVRYIDSALHGIEAARSHAKASSDHASLDAPTTPEDVVVAQFATVAIDGLPIDLITATLNRARGVLQLARCAVNQEDSEPVEAAITAAVSLLGILISTLSNNYSPREGLLEVAA